MHKIPSTIYEVLPYGYLLMGLWAISASADWLGILSALLLISAGIVIIKMRLHYRSPHQVMLRQLSAGRAEKTERERIKQQIDLFAQQ